VNAVIGNLLVSCPNSSPTVVGDETLEEETTMKETVREKPKGEEGDDPPSIFCPWRGKYSDLQRHIADCPFEKIRCDNSEFSCEWKGVRSHHREHLAECLYEPIKDILIKMKREADNAKRSLLELEERSKHLESVIDSQTGEWLKIVQMGEKLDAKDKHGCWYEATVIGLTPTHLRVHFDGWKSDFDENIPRTASRVAPLHMHSIKRRKRRRSSRRFRDFEEGDIIDCKDTMDNWYESTVLDVTDDQVLIHYESWSNVWDEWINIDSSRLAPLRTYSAPAAMHGRTQYIIRTRP
jgi:hypothetical protein